MRGFGLAWNLSFFLSGRKRSFLCSRKFYKSQEKITEEQTVEQTGKEEDGIWRQ